MTVIGEAFVQIKPDTRNFASSAEKDVTTQSKSLGSTAAKAFGGAFAAAAVFKFGKDAFKEAQDARKVAAQTEAVIRSTGGAANVTGAQIGKLANQFSNLTAIDDELIQESQNLLLTFTNVKNEVGAGNDIFTQATSILLDMGVALKTGPTGSAIQLGKALNDPIKGITALTRVGVTFTEQQKEAIKVAQARGDLAGAQRIILEELNKEFGGSAAAAATAEDRLGVVFANIQEEIGTALLPAIDAVSEGLSKALPAAIDIAGTALGGLKSFVDPVAGVFERLFKFAFDPQKGAFGKSRWELGLAEIQSRIQGFLLGTDAAASVQAQQVAGAFGIAPPTFGERVQATGETGLLGITLAQTQEDAEILAAANANASTFEQVVAKTGNIIADLFGLEGVELQASTVAQDFQVGLADISARLESGWARIQENASAFWRTWGDDLSSIVSGAFTVLSGIVEIGVSNIVQPIKVISDLLRGDFGKAWDDFKDHISTVFGGIVTVVQGSVATVVGVIGTVWQAVGAGVTGVLNGIIGGFEAALNFAIGIVNVALDALDKAAGPFVNFEDISKVSIPRIGGGAATGPQLTPIRGQFATGGVAGASGLFLVGENGPELVRLPTGAVVVPNNQLARGGSVDLSARTQLPTSTGSTFNVENVIVPVPPDSSPLEVASTLSEHFAWRFGATAVPA